jgi:ABC-type lipopolysaccharide export system ATPase subunit
MGLFNAIKKGFINIFPVEKSRQDEVYQEAHSLLGYLHDTYSIEEQTIVIENIRQYMINKREDQISEVEAYLERLKTEHAKLTKS